MDWVHRPQNYKDLHGILQLVQDSHLENFSLKTLGGGTPEGCFGPDYMSRAGPVSRAALVRAGPVVM